MHLIHTKLQHSPLLLPTTLRALNFIPIQDLQHRWIKEAMLTVESFYLPVSTRHTHPFNDPFPGLPRSAGTRKVKTNLDFTEARDSEWQWHQQGRMQVCTSLQTDNHANTSPLSFLQAGRPSCRQTNSVKALQFPHASALLY